MVINVTQLDSDIDFMADISSSSKHSNDCAVGKSRSSSCSSDLWAQDSHSPTLFNHNGEV